MQTSCNSSASIVLKICWVVTWLLLVDLIVCFSLLVDFDCLLLTFSGYWSFASHFWWQLDFRSQYDAFSEKKEVMTEMTHKLTAPIRILVNHEPVISQLKMLVYPVRTFSWTLQIFFTLNFFVFWIQGWKGDHPMGVGGICFAIWLWACLY